MYSAIECGGELRGPSGIIDVFNVTDEDESHQLCIWNVTVRSGRTISVKIVEMEMYSYDMCIDSYVLVGFSEQNAVWIYTASIKKKPLNYTPVFIYFT